MQAIDGMNGAARATTSSGLATDLRDHESSVIHGAGFVVILTGFALALLPMAKEGEGAVLIGAMMMLAGALEAAAGAFRRRHPAATFLPGLVTLAAGALFLFEPFGLFVPEARLLIAWLAVRAILLGVGGSHATGALRTWTYVAALVDSALAATVFLGLSASTFIVAMFGPTPEVVASFAWVLGASFLASGLLLIDTGRSAEANAGD